MKKVLKSWFSWVILALNTIVLILAIITHNYLAVAWILGATFWCFQGMIAVNDNMSLKRENIRLLIENQRLITENTLFINKIKDFVDVTKEQK